jgi:cellulose synthase/poly-beta-1,6-N-acetylglucosamine synthase-like glycosyltransferase
MNAVISFILVILTGLFAVPVCLFCVETLAAVSFPQRNFLPARRGLRHRIAVLIPAHNEGGGLRDTLDDVRAQLQSHDRILVVADNCTDDTAAVAKEAGAEVAERHNLDKVGKGYALDWGLQYLSADPPEIVIIVDADCRLANDALDRLATACAASGRPTQALYLIAAPAESPIEYRVAEFAFRVKNCVRPLGLQLLKAPCQLTGTGMAFQWETIRSVDLASGEIVEDLKLGLDLARMGHPPLFCPSAVVMSKFPLSIEGAKGQRKRWEQGHISMIATTVPRSIYESLTHGNFRLLTLALDAAIPPLTLLGMSLALMVIISGCGVLLGLSSSALAISLLSLSAYFIAVLLCWLKFGRDILPLSSIGLVISYVASKLPLYRQILSRGGSSRWIRTDRGKPGDDAK